MNELEGKIAVVTGANGDIGSDIVCLLAREGARVIGTYNRDRDKIDHLLKTVQNENLELEFVRLNVADEQSVHSFFSNRFVSDTPDILVNTAGLSSREVWFRKPSELRAHDWEEVYSVDVIGCFNCIKESAELMNHSAGGCSVVNFSSTAGIYGHTEGLPYTAAKAALIALTKSLAYVYAPKIRINAVAPGNIDAGSIHWYDSAGVASLKAESALGRLGTVREVSNLVLFLASEKSSFITGQTIIVDGGY
ncbi:MAG: SDR family oxidoreductase [Nitrososphaerota archaeon]|nr:SDR family oxidoreductase [Nitrososphaerota archaeon]MDG6923844.1 SDR family oxidoreductase [Nitrososphaerota archaeon]